MNNIKSSVNCWNTSTDNITNRKYSFNILVNLEKC